MQKPEGNFEQLTKEKLSSLTAKQRTHTISTGAVFKIKKCHFIITEINNEGIVAKGITRKEYFKNR